MQSVVFVCLGNICRSPMAEAVFRKMVDDAEASSEIKVDSCGTSGWHRGEPPHRGVMKELKAHGVPCDNIYSSMLGKEHFNADYIIAMDEQNIKDIVAVKPKGAASKIMLLSSFADKGGSWISVPDPWYTGNFELTYSLVEEGCRNLLKHMLNVIDNSLD